MTAGLPCRADRPGRRQPQKTLVSGGFRKLPIVSGNFSIRFKLQHADITAAADRRHSLVAQKTNRSQSKISSSVTGTTSGSGCVLNGQPIWFISAS